jgi:putative flippase GtrA
MFNRYLAVSAVSLGIDYGCYVALIRLFAMPPPAAAAAGYFAGLVVNYLLAVRYVFGAGALSANRLGEFVAYAATGGAGMAVSAGTVWACARAGLTNIHLGKAAAVGTSFFVVYALRRYVLFRPPAPEPAPATAPATAIDAR